MFFTKDGIIIEEKDVLWHFYCLSFKYSGQPVKSPNGFCPYFWRSIDGLINYIGRDSNVLKTGSAALIFLILGLVFGRTILGLISFTGLLISASMLGARLNYWVLEPLLNPDKKITKWRVSAYGLGIVAIFIFSPENVLERAKDLWIGSLPFVGISICILSGFYLYLIFPIVKGRLPKYICEIVNALNILFLKMPRMCPRIKSSPFTRQAG